MTKQTVPMKTAHERSSTPVAWHGLPSNIISPEADIFETPDAYVVSLDIPGAAKDSIAVTLEQGCLDVKASVQPMHAETASLVYREIRTTGYHRAFTLGEGIDRDNIDARYEEGVLTVKLLKSAELKPRQITIH
jgi:HSP20 family protein